MQDKSPNRKCNIWDYSCRHYWSQWIPGQCSLLTISGTPVEPAEPSDFHLLLWEHNWNHGVPKPKTVTIGMVGFRTLGSAMTSTQRSSDFKCSKTKPNVHGFPGISSPGVNMEISLWLDTQWGHHRKMWWITKELYSFCIEKCFPVKCSWLPTGDLLIEMQLALISAEKGRNQCSELYHNNILCSLPSFCLLFSNNLTK